MCIYIYIYAVLFKNLKLLKMKKTILFGIFAILMVAFSNNVKATNTIQPLESSEITKSFNLSVLKTKTYSYYFTVGNYTVNLIIKVYDDGSWGYMYGIQDNHGHIVSSGYGFFGTKRLANGSLAVDESTMEYYFDGIDDEDFFFENGFDLHLINEINSHINDIQ